MHFTVTLYGDLYGLYGDYEEEYGRMSFALGETRKTVRVRLIGDWHDEGPETFSLVLSDPRGATIADGEGIGTIINDDPIPAAWNARFGRTVAHQVPDAVEARMGSEPAPGLDVTLAGERLERTASPSPARRMSWQWAPHPARSRARTAIWQQPRPR